MKEDYPVFQKWNEILDWILDTSEKFPKNSRFTFSTRIINLSLSILELLIEAIYDSDNRKTLLKKINIELEKLRVFFRLSHSRKYISTKQYNFISKQINGFGKMIGGWIKS